MKEVIIRSLQGHATPAELRALAEWRQSDAENDALYLELEAIWRATSAPESTPAAHRPSAGDIVRGAGDNNPATVIPLVRPHAPALPSRRGWGLGWAALVVLSIGLTAIWVSLSTPRDSFSATEIITGPDELVTTRLSDGTTIRLAPRSRLLVRPEQGAREVWLDGQAFFAVAHDDTEPFTVRTRIGDALVLGTRFDIRVQDQEVRVAVVEGRVALAAQGERVEVGAGEVSRAAEGSTPEIEVVPDLQPLLAWMDGFLVFQDTPLATAAREIERRFGIRVLIPDPAVGERTVSAWFTTEDADQVLSVLCRAVGAHCTLGDSIASIEP